MTPRVRDHNCLRLKRSIAEQAHLQKETEPPSDGDTRPPPFLLPLRIELVSERPES